MPRISLWKGYVDEDYYFTNKNLSDLYFQGGTGILIHKYLGPKLESGDITDETTIGDLLFLENRERKYEDDVYELRGCYVPNDVDYNLTQFGIDLSSSSVIMFFHFNDMVSGLGRKIISGDVIEILHVRDQYLLDKDKDAINRFYVVEDADWAASAGFGPNWWPHTWRITIKALPDSEEYRDIFGDGDSGTLVDENGDKVGEPGCPGDLKCDQSTAGKDQEITDGIIAEAATHVQFDPKWYDGNHLWIEELADGTLDIWWWNGTDATPNGAPLRGSGTEFPEDMVEGEYYLRTDYVPNRLFQKRDGKYKIIYDDLRFPWTGPNQVYDSFVNNTKILEIKNGKKVMEKQALSKTVRPKIDMNVAKKKEHQRAKR